VAARKTNHPAGGATEDTSSIFINSLVRAHELADHKPSPKPARSRFSDPKEMKKITLENYGTDKHYARVVRAVEQILGRGDVVAPGELFTEMGLLAPESLKDWRFGRVPYLERVIRCNLSVASRILRIFSIHGHNLNLRPSITVYVRHGKGRRTPLRFTKSREPKLEEAYSRHFVRIGSKKKWAPGDADGQVTAVESRGGDDVIGEK
jgi:hypothetical protein